MVQWYYMTRAQYEALATSRKADYLYYLSDTGEIYRGTQPFTDSVILYDGTEPTAKAVNKIYVNSTTLEGKVWSGTAWKTVIQPLGAVDAANSTKPVAGADVVTYVTAAIAGVTGGSAIVKDVSFNGTTKKITVTTGDNKTKDVLLDGLGVSLSYNKTTGKLDLKDVGGTVLGTGINLDLERFVTSASYDAVNKKIILTFNTTDPPLEIDVAALVDTYTAADTSTIDMTVASNVMSGVVKVSADAGNTISAKADGLYVPTTDISGKLNVVTGAAGKLVITAANGQVAGSAAIIGGAALAATPNATTVATEAAVAAIRTALEATIAGKMTKVTAGDVGEILTADATGDAAASGVKIGGGAFKAAPDAGTLATELAVKAFGDATYLGKADIVAHGAVADTLASAADTKVASEKALVGLLQWHTN